MSVNKIFDLIQFLILSIYLEDKCLICATVFKLRICICDREPNPFRRTKATEGKNFQKTSSGKTLEPSTSSGRRFSQSEEEEYQKFASNLREKGRQLYEHDKKN